jgi:glycosyltransferase involved in cell wall biosynthesis
MEAGVEILPRSHYYLLRALERWRAEDPEIESRVRLLLVGESRPLDREIVARSSVASLITFAGYLPHAESVRVVREADLLFLPMHKLPPGQRATIVPGKVYEYLASGRPILAAAPAGDARDFLASAGSGLVCEPDDPESMVKILRAQFTRWSHGEAGPFVDAEYIARFERRELTRQLAERLNALPATIAADVPSR